MATFEGLYANFIYGSVKDTKLGLAPENHRAVWAKGEMTSIQFHEVPVDFSEARWMLRRQGIEPASTLDALPDPKHEPPPTPLSGLSGPSLERVEGLLAQIAAAAKWIGWALAALAVAVLLHLR